MRRTVMVLAAAAALVGTAALAPTPVSAKAYASPVLAPRSVQHVQYYGGGPRYRDDGWERRHHRREWRQERDEARIADAARREAYRIEAEREQRRAWRRAQHGYGYGPAYGFGQHRSW